MGGGGAHPQQTLLLLADWAGAPKQPSGGPAAEPRASRMAGPTNTASAASCAAAVHGAAHVGHVGGVLRSDADGARAAAGRASQQTPLQYAVLCAAQGGVLAMSDSTYAEDSRSRAAAKAKASETARTLRREDIIKFFHLTLVEAARQFEIGRTLFKSVCRREGIHEWPQPTRLIRRPNTKRNQERLRMEAEAADAELASRSKFIGVFWHRSVKKWQAQITYDMQTECLGSFADEQGGEEKAARAFDTAARRKAREPNAEHTDQHRRWVLNFPTEDDRRFDVARAIRAQQPMRVKQHQQHFPERRQRSKPTPQKKPAASDASAGPGARNDQPDGVEALALLAALQKPPSAAVRTSTKYEHSALV